MGRARGLFFAVAGAATLGIACVIPWQESANPDLSSSPLGNVSITPLGEAGRDATAGSEKASSRAGATADVDGPSPEVATLAPRTALGSPQKETQLPADRPQLAYRLQRELARVGCYEGEFSGIWTPAARKAMKAFVERVNAALPTDEPDYILLTLVQGARDKVCGASCPADQSLADGRCIPNAVLAGRKAAQTVRAAPLRSDPGPAATGWSVTRTPTDTAPPSSADKGGMGLAGPPSSKVPGVADAQSPVAGLNAPAPPPVAVAAPGTRRPAYAKRAATQTGFGFAIFKQLGF
jgi:hypothetical protein